jgi:hypothetical protein
MTVRISDEANALLTGFERAAPPTNAAEAPAASPLTRTAAGLRRRPLSQAPTRALVSGCHLQQPRVTPRGPRSARGLRMTVGERPAEGRGADGS